MPELLGTLVFSNSFIPHGHCYLWRPSLVWLHLLSDASIALAYYSIPITLLYFVRKRQDLPFDWIFLLFGAFIVFCGTTHLMEVWTLWHPDYWVSGVLKAATAVVSLYTAFALVRLMPQALSLPSPAQLAAVNAELQEQIEVRQQAEAQVRQLNRNLEAKVAERTAELERSMIQVRDYAERVTLVMDAAKLGSWDWDLQTQVIRWNVYHEMLFGYQPGQAERRYEDWLQRIHPDDLPWVEAQMQQSRAQGIDFSAEHRVVWEDGSLHWIAAFGRFYYDAANQPIRMAGMIQDITERKQITEALQISEERLRLTTEAADIGMWFWNLETDELLWTTRCKALFGLGPDVDISYERFLAGIYVEDRDLTHAAVKQAIETNKEYEIEYRSVWPDGTLHWIAAKGHAFYDDQGKPVRMMGIAQDVTDRKQTEVALQDRARDLSRINLQLMQATAMLNRRNQELDQFAHIVSHDLKSPLRAIASLSVWIEEDLVEEATPEVKQHLELMQSRISHMNTLIDGLLTYARIGYQEAPCETFALNELLEEVVTSLDVPPDFTVQIPSNLPVLNTHRLLLSQVLANLISNAIKHHERPNGQVQVRVRPGIESYEFEVADDGPGIAPDHREHVFDIFQTFSSSSKDSTGIGLALVKKIVERVGGEIHLESELGQGTTFRFTWPNLKECESGVAI
ncbi:MAG TPA: PAS domain-containing protein [Stenomitos sp.]